MDPQWGGAEGLKHCQKEAGQTVVAQRDHGLLQAVWEGYLKEVDPVHSSQSIHIFHNCFKCPRRHLGMNSLNPWLELMVETLLLPPLHVPELRGGNYVLPVTGRYLLLGLGEGTGGYLCQVAGVRDGEGMEARGEKWSQHEGLKCQCKARDSVTAARVQTGMSDMLLGSFVHMPSLPVMSVAVFPVCRTAHGTE